MGAMHPLARSPQERPKLVGGWIEEADIKHKCDLAQEEH
jgi:hypothetical protein